MFLCKDRRSQAFKLVAVCPVQKVEIAPTLGITCSCLLHASRTVSSLIYQSDYYSHTSSNEKVQKCAKILKKEERRKEKEKGIARTKLEYK